MDQTATCKGLAGCRIPAAASLVILAFLTQAALGNDERPAAGAHPSGNKGSPYHAVSVPERAKGYYRLMWGIENMVVRRTASDNLIRFSYRVADAQRAKALGDKQATPFLIDQRSHAVLQIPVMDKVGQLRQSGTPQAGREYWMVFSNKGNLVRGGDRVNVVIGSFHVEGLIVE